MARISWPGGASGSGVVGRRSRPRRYKRAGASGPTVPVVLPDRAAAPAAAPARRACRGRPTRGRRGRRPRRSWRVVDEMFEDHERYGTTYAVAIVQGGRLLLERYGGALPALRPAARAGRAHHAAALVVDGEVGAARGGRRAGGGGPARASTRRPGVPELDRRARRHHARPAPADARRAPMGRGLRRRRRVRRDRDAVRQRAGRRGRLRGGPTARPPARHGLQLLVGHVEHRGGDARPSGRVRRRRAPVRPRPGAAPDRHALGRPARSTPPARSSGRRTSTPPPRTGPASAPCTSATACGTGGGSCPRAGSTTAAGCAPVDPTDGSLYGAHWWIDQLDTERGTFRASGYEGQAVAICPALDAVVVRLGRDPRAPARPRQPPALAPPRLRRPQLNGTLYGRGRGSGPGG